MESSRKLLLRGIGATPLVSIPIEYSVKVSPATVTAVYFQVGRDVRHIAEMGVVQVEHHFVLIFFLAQITGNDCSVLTKGVNVDIDVERLFELRYFG